MNLQITATSAKKIKAKCNIVHCSSDHLPHRCQGRGRQYANKRNHRLFQ